MFMFLILCMRLSIIIFKRQRSFICQIVTVPHQLVCLLNRAGLKVRMKHTLLRKTSFLNKMVSGTGYRVFSTCFRGSDIGFSSHILCSETFNRINNQVPLTSRLLTNLTVKCNYIRRAFEKYIFSMSCK